MTKREIIKAVLNGERPPYVPWSFAFTKEAEKKLVRHYGPQDIERILGNHLLKLGSDIGFFEPMGCELYKDVFGVIWDRSLDKDIGNVACCPLQTANLAGYEFPDPLSPVFFEDIDQKIEEFPERFRVFQIGFSLYERAWTLRGMENLMTDFCNHPSFVHELMERITTYNLVQINKALDYGIDAVYFGDDWGQQRGLQMGAAMWHEFIHPYLARMYARVREEGKYVFIHSCGDVDELFDDLLHIGVNCFNPFQPEVMDVASLIERYRGRMTFHGGLSTQKTLPLGTVEEVRAQTRKLLQMGREGSYIFAPAHAVQADVPLDNMLAFIDEVQRQQALDH